METKKTLIIGASTDASRYSFIAANRLLKHGYSIELLGRNEGEVAGHIIHTQKLDFEDIDTVTLYVNPRNQVDYYDYILKLNPRRVIFNPGTENPEFENKLSEKGIEPIEACTLVMLSIGNY